MITKPRIFSKLFIDENTQHHYETHGFATIPLLNAETLQQMRSLFYTERSNIKEDVTHSVYASGCSTDYDLRKRIGQIIDSTIPALLNGIVNTDSIELMGGTMLLKAPGENGFLQAHFDNPVLDENKFSSAFLWVPLEDVNETNGCVYVLPATHLIDHGPRGMMSPFPYKQWDEIIYKYGVPITVKAGTALVMDHALLHYSLNNHSNKERIAFTFNLKPKAAQQIHYYYRQDTNEIELFKTDVAFYFNENFFERPQHLEKIGSLPYRMPFFTEQEFSAYLEKASSVFLMPA